MSADTPPEIEVQLDRLFAQRGGEERLRMAADMFETARLLALADILTHNPGLTDRETKCRLFERFYGEDLSPEDFEYFRRRLGARVGATQD